MVTHDVDLAKRVDRAVIVSDGEVIDQYLARTFPALTEDQLVEATRSIQPERHEPGAIILKEGLPADKFFIVTRGQAEVVLEGPDGSDIVVARMNPGQYFGEIELRHGGTNIATIRAALHEGLDVVGLEREMFDRLVAESPATREAIDRVVEERLEEHEAAERRSRRAMRRPHEDGLSQTPARPVAEQRAHAAGGVKHLHRRVCGRHGQRMNDLLPARMISSYRETNPAHVLILLNGIVTDDDVNHLARLPGVAGLEGERELGARWRLAADEPWRDASITMRGDYTRQKFNTTQLISGEWPTKDGIVVEQSTVDYFHVPTSGTLTLQINQREREIQDCRRRARPQLASARLRRQRHVFY